MPKKLYLSLTFLLILALLTGCVQIQLPVEADQEEEEEEKELTAEEVLTKASEELEKLDGINFDSKTEGKSKLEKDGTEIINRVAEDVNVKLVFEPLALYGKGTYQKEGETYPVEVYLTNQNLHMKDSDYDEWIEQGSRPVDEQLRGAWKELASDDPRKAFNETKEGLKDHLKMEKEADTYVVTFEPDNQTAKEAFQKWAEINSSDSSTIAEELGRLDIKMNRKIWIDERSFELKRLELDFDINGIMEEASNAPVVVDIHQETTINGEVKSITPPQDLDEDDF